MNTIDTFSISLIEAAYKYLLDNDYDFRFSITGKEYTDDFGQVITSESLAEQFLKNIPPPVLRLKEVIEKMGTEGIFIECQKRLPPKRGKYSVKIYHPAHGLSKGLYDDVLLFDPENGWNISIFRVHAWLDLHRI
jgi:hypothetical protein